MGPRVARQPVGRPSLDAGAVALAGAGGNGSVVFTSNSSARLGKAYWGAYGVADIALEGMARMWADELAGSGRVRANVFVPGPVNSPSRRNTHPGESPAENPSPTLLAPRYVYLLGPASLGVNGQVVESAG